MACSLLTTVGLLTGWNSHVLKALKGSTAGTVVMSKVREHAYLPPTLPFPPVPYNTGL